MSAALVIQLAERMRRIVLPSVACLGSNIFFSTLPHKRHDLGGGGEVVTDHIMCVLIFIQLPPEILFILKRIKRDIIISVGHAVAQLVEALRYMSEGRGFNSLWCHWNFSLT